MGGRGGWAGYVLFIQRAQPDVSIILILSLCMCLSPLVLKMVQYVMGRLEIRSNKGKLLLEGRAKTFHLSSLLIKMKVAITASLVYERKEASGS